MFDAVFDSRDRALRWAPFEFDLGSANKEDLGQRVAEVTREGLAGVGPEVHDGLYSRRIGGVDGDLWGGVLVEEELGLRDCAGEGGKVCIEGGPWRLFEDVSHQVVRAGPGVVHHFYLPLQRKDRIPPLHVLRRRATGCSCEVCTCSNIGIYRWS